MKYSSIILVVLLSALAFTWAYEIQEADNEADIVEFEARHIQDSHVLFFVKSEEKKDSGFFSGLFSLFSSSDSGESYAEEISNNNPVLKVDLSKEALAHAEKDYDVKEVPYIIAYHKKQEIFRGKPDSNTAGDIEDIINHREEAGVKQTEKPLEADTKKSSSETPVEDTKSSETHNHPKPLTVVPDYGHMSTNDPAESNLIDSRPIEEVDAKAEAIKQQKSESGAKPVIPPPASPIAAVPEDTPFSQEEAEAIVKSTVPDAPKPSETGRPSRRSRKSPFTSKVAASRSAGHTNNQKRQYSHYNRAHAGTSGTSH